MTEIARKEFWIPGQRMGFDHDYPVPSTEVLNDRWSEYLGRTSDVIAAPGVYGSVRKPDSTPLAYASVDLCEIVRETSKSLRAVEESPSKPIECIHCYAGGLAIGGDVVPVVQALMNHGQVPPVDEIGSIRRILQTWRAKGVYVFANTSTLPGCELSTIDFFANQLPNSFDGILLPRNHDGSLPLTKGVAARNLLQLFGVEQADHLTPVIHIDDVSHHNTGFRSAMQDVPGIHVATFQPRYPSCKPLDEGSHITNTPLEAFQQADAFLSAQVSSR